MRREYGQFRVGLGIVFAGAITACGGGGGGGGTGGASWTIQTVDASANVGHNSRIALDSGSRPHIVSRDVTTGVVAYSRWDGASWIRQSFGDLESPGVIGLFGGHLGLAIDATDRIHVSYHQADVSYFYTYWNGSSWSTPAAIPAPESAWAYLGYDSLAVERATGVVHVAVANSDPGYELSHWTSGPGGFLVVDNTSPGIGVGFKNSIAVDGSGGVHISYHAEDAGSNALLMYAYNGGSGWATSVVAPGSAFSNTNLQGTTSIAVDGAGTPHIAYWEDGLGYRLASKTGGTWSLATIDSSIAPGPYQSISLAFDGTTPHVVYTAFSYVLRHATLTGSAWVTDVVDPAAAAAADGTEQGAIAVAADGTLHVSYRHCVSGSPCELHHATR